MDRPTLITDQRNLIMLKMLWLMAVITCALDLVSGRHFTLFQYLIMFIILLLSTLLLKGEVFCARVILSTMLILFLSLRFFWQSSLINLLSLYLGIFLIMVYQSYPLILGAGLATTLVTMGVFQLQQNSVVAAVEEMQAVWFIIPGLVLTIIMVVLNRFMVTRKPVENQRQQWHSLQEGFDIITWSYEIDTGQLFLSRGAEKLTGLPVDSLMQQPEKIQKLIHPYDAPRLLEAYKALRAGKKRIVEHRLLLTNGSTRWLQNLAIPFKNQTGKVIRVDGLIIDISEQKSKEEKIKHMAFYDQLTGLPNRTMFENYFAITLAGERQRGKKVALIFIDLDDFKHVNDKLGHDVGDILLKEVGTRLKTIMRESDLLARLGGDEFIALLTSVSRETITLVAERIMESFAHGFSIEGHELYVGASIGISLYPEDGKDLETLIKSADEAMYTAKRKGKNQYYFHTG